MALHCPHCGGTLITFNWHDYCESCGWPDIEDTADDEEWPRFYPSEDSYDGGTIFGMRILIDPNMRPGTWGFWQPKRDDEDDETE